MGSPTVSHARLLWVLRRKGYPELVVQYVESFLTNRRTRISFNDYDSEWMSTNTGIPQGSALSPVLFLVFIADLLETFESARDGIIGTGFADDTDLVA
jgi:ribonuclease P/MRP protein subunit RPP40